MTQRTGVAGLRLRLHVLLAALAAAVPGGGAARAQKWCSTSWEKGFWSIFKCGVIGTFHKMSAKYMPLYIAEFQFRYNNRDNRDNFGTAIKEC